MHAYGHTLGLGFSANVSECKDEESADEQDVMLEEARVLVLESHNSDAILRVSTVAQCWCDKKILSHSHWLYVVSV